ncbi:MAG TPA: hypothetical protein VIU61_20040 [Kofleriaceae bacterium]
MTRTFTLALVLVSALGCGKKEETAPAAVAKPTTPEPTPAPAPTPPPAPAPTPPPAPAADDVSKIKFTGVPEDWTAQDGKIEFFVAVNESKFPVDNATFEFEYGFETKLPTNEKDFDKKSKTPGGALYESSKDKSWRYVLDNGTGPKIVCGGSGYRSDDYNKIPKERDAAIAKAKKVCASAKI